VESSPALADLLEQAVSFHQSGQLHMASDLYQKILQIVPDHFDAMHLSGVIDMQVGQTLKAESLIRNALRINPFDAGAHNNLGTVLLRAGNLEEACAQFMRAIDLQPDHLDALTNLGALQHRVGRSAESILTIEKALCAHRESAELFALLASALMDVGDTDGAKAAYVQTTLLAPGDAIAHNNLGAFLRETGELHAAIESLSCAVKLDPALPQALSNLAELHFELGSVEQSVDAYSRLLSLGDVDAFTHHAYGNSLMAYGKAREAVKEYQCSVQLDPERANARWALAMAHIRPLYDDVEEVNESRLAFARAINELDAWFIAERVLSGPKAVGSTQPFYLAYQAQNNLALLVPYGRLCARLMEAFHKPTQQISSVSVLVRKLRVGVVSAQVRNHSVWVAITKGWVDHLDPSRFEVHIFHLGRHSDDETIHARREATDFIDTPRTLSDWVQAIVDAQLDVLIFPEIGMDSLTTQLAAQRLAPVQAASWGHPHTSGLPTIDLFLSAELFEPAQGDSHYSERLVRLPNLGVCVEPLAPVAIVPDLVALGLPVNEALLLCPGVLFKYRPEHDEVWAALGLRLQARGDGRLVFFQNHRAGMANQFEQRLRRSFGRMDVDFDRTVCIIPTLPRDQFYGLMQSATVMLDTIGFSGFNTAIQALECGLPIVAHEGEFMRGRLASGLLRRIGLHEWVAKTNIDFIDKAMRLLEDETLRAVLIQQMLERRAVLFNDLSTVRALEQVLIQASAGQC